MEVRNQLRETKAALEKTQYRLAGAEARNKDLEEKYDTMVKIKTDEVRSINISCARHLAVSMQVMKTYLLFQQKALADGAKHGGSASM